MSEETMELVRGSGNVFSTLARRRPMCVSSRPRWQPKSSRR